MGILSDDALPCIIFSTSADYFSAAKQELQATFGKHTMIERLAPDTGSFTAQGIDIAHIAQACRHMPLVFIRHLMRGMLTIPSPVVAHGPQPLIDAAFALLREHHDDSPIALQVWMSEKTMISGCRPDELRKHLLAELTAQGYTLTRGNQSRVLSVCLTPQITILGINARNEALSDWPGGRFGLAKSAGQISRAEFKLEELFKVFPLALPSNGNALDLGASPGGWTHLLRQSGLTVWAVDPAELDPRIADDPGVLHIQTTSGAFLAEAREMFDVVVNDMRMDAELSCEIMAQAARQLRPGGIAIVTLKLFKHKPLDDVHRAVRILKRSYEMLFARQLFHNRHEVTVVVRCSTAML